MGLDINGVRFLIAARQAGFEFRDVLTLGRLDLKVYPAKMAQMLASKDFPARAFTGFGSEMGACMILTPILDNRRNFRLVRKPA